MSIQQLLPSELHSPIQTLLCMSDHADKCHLDEAKAMIEQAIEKIKKIFSENDTMCLEYFERTVCLAYGIKVRQLHSRQKSMDISGAKALVIYFIKQNSLLKPTAIAKHFGITRRQVERLNKSVVDMLAHPNGNKRLFEKYNIVRNQYESDYDKKEK